jgi:hypothetical protein
MTPSLGTSRSEFFLKRRIRKHDTEDRCGYLTRHIRVAWIMSGAYPPIVGVVIGTKKDCLALLRNDLG